MIDEAARVACYPRIRVSGWLQVRSPLHVGSGDTEQFKARLLQSQHEHIRPEAKVDLKGLYNAMMTDLHGRAYIPGSSLRGCLRAIAGLHMEQDRFEEKLFGPPEGGERRAGKLRVADVRIDDKQLPEQQRAEIEQQSTVWERLPYWSQARRTFLRHGIAIDPITGAVMDGHLYRVEALPEGTLLHVCIEAENIGEDELRFLMQLLRSVDEASLTSLGRGASNDEGRICWRADLEHVEALTKEGLGEFLTDPEEKPLASFFWEIKLDAGGQGELVKRSSPNSLQLHLLPMAPMLVAEPGLRKVTTNEDSPEPSHEYSRDGRSGRPVIPARSLRGALRARAQRIASTLALSISGEVSVDVTQRAAYVGKLLAEQLFGSADRRGLVAFEDAKTIGSFMEHVQHFNAIDRFTGGVSGSKLYKVRAALVDRLDCVVRRLGPLEPWQQGLLLQVLRDGFEGDLALGWGKARGYGAMRIEACEDEGLPWPSAALLKWLGATSDCRTLARELSDAVLEAFTKLPIDSALIDWTLNQRTADADEVAEVKLHNRALNLPDNGTCFRPPFQFLMLNGRMLNDPTRCSDASKVKNGQQAGGTRHDIWLPGVRSGRIICKLHLERPLIVGSEHRKHENRPTDVDLYRLADVLAIPGSSLRGMICSLMEALSQSSMRVLHDASLSRRNEGEPGRTEFARVHSLFDGAYGPNALPWNPSRTQLTPAEAIAGVVAESDLSPNETSAALPALASRIRFADALAGAQDNINLLPARRMQILASPRPDSSFYHLRKIQQGVQACTKAELLKNTGRLVPRGRKFYLHHPENALHFQSGADASDDKQRLYAQQIDKGQSFYFHVEFDNLSDEELALLLCALRPCDEFRHRLGAAKPLGLGSVEVSVLAVLEVDRPIRYESAVDAARYTQVYRGDALDDGILGLLRHLQVTHPATAAGRYAADCAALRGQGVSLCSASPLSDSALLGERLSTQHRLIDANALRHLSAIGNCQYLAGGTTAVSYPRTNEQLRAWKRNQPEGEAELFQWYANNEAHRHQLLGLVETSDGLLPALRTNGD